MAFGFEYSGFSRQLRRVLGGEGDADVPFLTDGDTGKLLFKAGNEHPAAQNEGIALGFAAFKGNTVCETLEVDGDLIAHCRLFRMFDDHMLVQIFVYGVFGILFG